MGAVRACKQTLLSEGCLLRANILHEDRDPVPSTNPVNMDIQLFYPIAKIGTADVHREFADRRSLMVMSFVPFLGVPAVALVP